MIHRALARCVIVFIHAAYVAFVVFGSLLVIHWPALIWIHLAAVAWAVATLVLSTSAALLRRGRRLNGGLGE